MDFAALPLSAPLQQVLAELGLQTLTPVQEQSLPTLLAGRDLLARSQTGTGKTIAFALPLLEGVELATKRVQGLVLCPTRELAAQAARELRRLGRRLPGLHVLVVSGGEPVRLQVAALGRGAQLVVGTPGRVLDLIGRGALELLSLRSIVLDEADRMLDMGFREDLEKILSATPPTRRTALFSATFPPEIEALGRTLLRDPVRVAITETIAAPDITQQAVACTQDGRTEALVRLLRHFRPESAIVFCNLKSTVSELTAALAEAGVRTDGLQGDLEQEDRDQALAKFRNRSTRVLVATDVAARGLDVEAVEAVFNYELPRAFDAYVHRIGRTGRAGRTGLAVTLVAPRDEARLEQLEREVGVKLERIELPSATEDRAPLESAMATLRIDAGRKDKLRPGDIVGALTGEAGGLNADDVGRIELHDRHAFVAVSRALASTALARLKAGKIKGRRFGVERVR